MLACCVVKYQLNRLRGELINIAGENRGANGLTAQVQVQDSILNSVLYSVEGEDHNLGLVFLLLLS